MSLIEKIDEMIRECSLPGGCDCLSDSINSAKRKLLREIKHLIISDQKEPLTIGDKIRESNESLAEHIVPYHCMVQCNSLQKLKTCKYYESCKSGILSELDQPINQSIR